MQIMPPPAGDYGFFNNYISLAPSTDLITALGDNINEIKVLALDLSKEQLDLRYAPGKWTVKENFAHLADAERNFCYRMMRISRGDHGILPVFDIHTFVVNAHAESRSIESIIEELEHLRNASICMFRGMTPAMIDLTGPARDITISVRALGFAMVGHSYHHLASIKEKYLASAI